jgi:hypothetical protein
MSYHEESFPTRKVDLSKKYHVWIGPLTKAEGDESNVILTEGSPTMESLQSKIHQKEYTDYVLFKAIKSWNLDEDVKDSDGKVSTRALSITLESVQGLLSVHAVVLMSAVREISETLYEVMTRQD